MQRGRQPQVTPVPPAIISLHSVDQNPRLLNVGPKPAKWAGDTPLSTFKTDLILHFRATELPRQKWGIASVAFLDNACKTTFLARVAEERGLQSDPELIAQAQISWYDFSRIMTDIYGHQVTDHDIKVEIDSLTKPNSSGPDTVSFLQVLDQLYGLCKHPVDEYTKIQQLQTALRGDLSRATQLQANGQL